MVITNSFHCVVFSVLFHRPFVVIKFSGKQERMNNRVFEFLTELDLTDRIVDPNSNHDPVEILKRPTNWPSVDDKIREMRKKGWKYLEWALAENERNTC